MGLIFSDPLDIITSACGLFAKCFAYIACRFSGWCLIPDFEEVIETAYLLIATFAYSFIALYHQQIYFEPRTFRLRSLVLSTYVRWFDELTYPYLYMQHGGRNCDLKFVQQVCKLRGAQVL